MYQIVYNFKGKKCHFNIDTEKEAKREYKMYTAMGCNPVVYHTSTPVPPSCAPVHGSGACYRKDCFTGWKKMESSSFSRDGFSVVFECYGEADIEMFCDALNGWFTKWTKYKITYKDKKGEISITVKKISDADKLFDLVNKASAGHLEHEEVWTAADTARGCLESIVEMLK